MLKTINIDLLYQGPIDAPPPQVGNLYENACSADTTTIDHWRETWLKQYAQNKELVGSYADKSVGKLYAINQHKPAIILGSGPSLKDAIPALKKNAALNKPLLTVSCLHNFGLFQDEGIDADYYVSIDAGPIVITDIHEGRNQTIENYWVASEGKKLIASPMSHPDLIKNWRGEIYFINSLLPDFGMRDELAKIERFAHYVSCGGNALGACFYIAKAIMGSNPIIFVGGDFCFDYDNTFHSYKTHYDDVGHYMMWPDVFGLPRKTWGSYLNFKYWFDHIAMSVPGIYINCTGGILGAYREGNLKHFQYMPLEQALNMYSISEVVQLEVRDGPNGVLREKKDLKLKELFSNAQFESDLVLF